MDLKPIIPAAEDLAVERDRYIDRTVERTAGKLSPLILEPDDGQRKAAQLDRFTNGGSVGKILLADVVGDHAHLGGDGLVVGRYESALNYGFVLDDVEV